MTIIQLGEARDTCTYVEYDTWSVPTNKPLEKAINGLGEILITGYRRNFIQDLAEELVKRFGGEVINVDPLVEQDDPNTIY